MISRSLACAALTMLCACLPFDYEPMVFAVDGDRFVATGAVDGSTPAAFAAARQAEPGITTLVLQYVEGSVDDEANVVLGRAVRAAGFTTIVPSDGLAASGGTDLFLAGRTRILEPGACVGVHSWSSGREEGGAIARDRPEHALYLKYYGDLGIPDTFYWFTLAAAPADGMHWVDQAEAARFGMTTRAPAQTGSPDACIAR